MSQALPPNHPHPDLHKQLLDASQKKILTADLIKISSAVLISMRRRERLRTEIGIPHSSLRVPIKPIYGLPAYPGPRVCICSRYNVCGQLKPPTNPDNPQLNPKGISFTLQVDGRF